MFCGQCGLENPPDNRFCTGCGSPVVTSPPAPVPVSSDDGRGSAGTPQNGTAREIKELLELRNRGVLSPDEFEMQKARLLGHQGAPSGPSIGPGAAAEAPHHPNGERRERVPKHHHAFDDFWKAACVGAIVGASLGGFVASQVPNEVSVVWGVLIGFFGGGLVSGILLTRLS